VQVEMHGKLLDRLTTNEDLLAYAQSPAGSRFLESTPISLEAESARSAPVRPYHLVDAGRHRADGAWRRPSVRAEDASRRSPAGRSASSRPSSGRWASGLMVSAVAAYVVSGRLGILPAQEGVR
jgi:hypothetical protein